MTKEHGEFLNMSLIHGDIHLLNVFFKCNPDGSLKRENGVPQYALIDW